MVNRGVRSTPVAPPSALFESATVLDAVAVSSADWHLGVVESASLDDSIGAGGFAWQFADGATLFPRTNSSIVLATGVPNGAIISASPDLLPGQSLLQSGDTLSLVSDSTLPTTDNDRDIAIEVMNSDQAVAQIMRTGELFGAGQSGANAHIQYAMVRMQDGDTLQISPGAIWLPGNGDGSSYLEDGGLHIWKSCTVQNIPGRGRWRFAPPSTLFADNWSGIVIREPNQTYAGVNDTQQFVNPRKTIVVEGFDFDNWGRLAGDKGVRIRAEKGDSDPTLTVNNWHASVTLRNFKVHKLLPYGSGSGISGAAQALTLEDGYVCDVGNGTGQEHNLYITAETMTLRGLRNGRTRGFSSAPVSIADWDNLVTLEGHLAKLDAITGSIEGCSFDCATLGDQSLLLQLKGGGNWTVRGNLFVDSKYPKTAQGAITMLREHGQDGTNNFVPWAGTTGNSLLFEKNVYISHYPRPIIWFMDPAVLPTWALYAAGDTSVGPEQRMSSLVVRDNIAMVTPTTATWMLSGFPGANNAMWINLDPNAGTNWAARGNSIVAYDPAEAAFNDRLLKQYTLAAGPIAAVAGSVTTQRFQWPHGSVVRTDAYRGLA